MSSFYSIYPNEDFFKRSAELILKTSYDKNAPEKLAECLIWVPSGRMMQALKNALTH